MSVLPLFLEPDPTRDRALGMVIGAVHGAQAARHLAPRGLDWPQAEDVLLHLSESLVELDELQPPDVVRRLVGAWAAQAGRPSLIRTVRADRRPRPSSAWVAGLAPICCRRQGDQRTAQFEAAQLAKTFNAAPADGEAMEVCSLYLRQAILTGDRKQALGAFDWPGDRRVCRLAEGRSLPLNTECDLVATLDQARAAALCHVAFPVVLEALVTVRAEPAAFILAGMLVGALEGRAPFLSTGSTHQSARLELAIYRLLHRASQPRARNRATSE
jgi:hypothetical protein